jgi:hypothetical protein
MTVTWLLGAAMISNDSDIIAESLYKWGYGLENMGGVVFHGLSRINLETCDG